MDKTIEEIKDELVLIEKRKLELENLIGSIVNDAISRAAKTKPMNRIGKHCFTVRFSELVGHPWTPSYYDWNKSADIIKRFLMSKPRLEWESSLKKKLEETKPGKEVVFVFTSGSGCWRTTESVPVSPKFIQEIINQLNLKELL